MDGINAATLQDINRWLDRLYDVEDHTHMIVVCDQYDWSDFPRYVDRSENVREVEAKYNEGLHNVMEVYSRNHTREEQLAERRAFHYD